MLTKQWVSQYATLAYSRGGYIAIAKREPPSRYSLLAAARPRTLVTGRVPCTI
eukprot:COSAG02_NODE_1743_length_11100_cov_17.677575_16_plen_53_part_00